MYNENIMTICEQFVLQAPEFKRIQLAHMTICEGAWNYVQNIMYGNRL